MLHLFSPSPSCAWKSTSAGTHSSSTNFSTYIAQLVIEKIASGIAVVHQVESLLCSITDSAASDNRDLLRSRLRLAAAREQILAEVTLRHDCL